MENLSREILIKCEGGSIALFNFTNRILSELEKLAKVLTISII